jgi:hypothetical protein
MTDLIILIGGESLVVNEAPDPSLQKPMKYFLRPCTTDMLLDLYKKSLSKNLAQSVFDKQILRHSLEDQ